MKKRTGQTGWGDRSDWFSVPTIRSYTGMNPSGMSGSARKYSIFSGLQYWFPCFL